MKSSADPQHCRNIVRRSVGEVQVEVLSLAPLFGRYSPTLVAIAVL